MRYNLTDAEGAKRFLEDQRPPKRRLNPKEVRRFVPAKPLCYYAHPMSLYHTAQEQRDIELLESLGFEVLNPNSPEHEAEASRFSRKMDYYERLVDRCYVVAFRALPDGSITSGVANEIKRAKRVIELPSGVSRRMLTIAQTIETLAELGER